MTKKDLRAAPTISVLSLWQRGRERLDSLFSEPAAPAERTRQIADLLQDLWPGASLTACCLQQASGQALSVQTAATAGLEPLVREFLQQQLSQPAGRTGPTLAAVPVPATVGTRLYATAVQGTQTWQGTLALAWPDQTAQQIQPDLEVLLPILAQHLGWHLQLAEQQHHCQELRQQLAEQQALGDLAETIGPVLHEMGNVLNHVVLELGALERQIPAEHREKVKRVRQLGRSFVTMMTQYANYRSGVPGKPYPVAWPELLRQVSTELTERIGPVQLDLPDALPPVWSTRIVIERLFRLLLLHFSAAAASPAPLHIRAEVVPDKVRLHLERQPQTIPEEWLPHFFEPFFPERAIQTNMELAACHGMVHRMRGNLDIVPAPSGLRLALELPTKAP